MVCIMLNRFFEISEKWLFDRLCTYIKPTDKVVIIPFAFREDEITNSDEWNKLFDKKGKYTSGMIKSFEPYGISESNFDVVNYFSDSKDTARKKVLKADILYFTGGLPDKMMCRLKEFELVEHIRKHKGAVIGLSAGAMIMLDKYHITPDKDYPEFIYQKGLGIVSRFDIEVHFDNTPVQLESINHSIKETKLPVYAISDGGALIINNNEILLAGNTCVYSSQGGNI